MQIVISKSEKSGYDYKFEEELDESGFDPNAIWMYFYPSQLDLRPYQFKAVQKALFKNVLLCLPTGLGKTLVAAVVMLNYYRWFPHKKVIFIAHTRPLVSQQQHACISVGGIRPSDITCVTGTLSANKRVGTYSTFRVFFMTPQVLHNDISNGVCNPNDVSCLVIDEAHKALKNHAFCQVSKIIQSVNAKPRILALTASPGENINIVQQLVENMSINEIVYFHEDHDDVKDFVQNRNITEVVLNFEGQVKELSDLFSQKLGFYLSRLSQAKAISNPNVSSWSAYKIMITIDNFKNRRNNFSSDQYKSLLHQLHVLHFYFTTFERLTFYGVLAFTRSIFSPSSPGFERSVGFSQLQQDHDFFSKIKSIHENIESCLNESRKPDFPYHPKITYLVDFLTRHFRDHFSEINRVIIFSHYRDSVDEIIAALKCEPSLIKPMPFVGQSGPKGLKQTEQIETLQKFRNGDYNVLVSTSVGEEGLDICEVNLIIFFDISSSPLRLIQRMGRTGRKKSGEIIILMMKGREQSSYNRAQNKSRAMTSTLKDKLNQINYPTPYYLIPENINPFCVFVNLRQNISITTKQTKKSKSKETNFNTFNISFKKPPFLLDSYNILGIPGTIHSLKSNCLHRILIKYPPITSYNIRPVLSSLQPHKLQNFPDAFSQKTKKMIDSDSDLDFIIPSQNCQKPCFNNETSLNINPTNILPDLIDDHDSKNDFINFEIHDSDEDQIKLKPKKRIISSCESIPVPKKMKKPSKFKSLGRQMLLTQAEVGSGSSDTEISDQNEYVQDSFINDESVDISTNIPLQRQFIVSPVKPRTEPSRPSRWETVIQTIEAKARQGDESILTSQESQTFQSCDTPITIHSCLTNSEGSQNLNNDFTVENLIDITKMKEDLKVSLQDSNSFESIETEKPILLVSSNAMLGSLVPSLLRHKFGFDLINFTNMTFDFMLGRNIAADIIKVTDIVKEQCVSKRLKQYSISSKLYSKLFIIFQHESEDGIDLNSSRQMAIFSIFEVCNPSLVTVMYSHSQEKTAQLLNDIVYLIDEENKIPALKFEPLKLSQVVKLASLISNLNIISPSSALELVIGANSFSNLINSGNPIVFQSWSPGLTQLQAQHLYNIISQYILCKPTC